MKIYVLTLKGETERRENVIKEFQKIGIKPTFFEGIDGRKLSKAELKKIMYK